MKLPHISMTAFIDSLIIIKAVLIGILLIIGIWLLGRLDTQTQQTKALAVQNNKLSQQLAASNEDIKSHIDCIITFFGLPNRASLSIRDICHFSPSSELPNLSIPNAPSVPQQSKASSPPVPHTENKPNTPSPQPSTIQKIENTLTNVVDKLNPLD